MQQPTTKQQFANNGASQCKAMLVSCKQHGSGSSHQVSHHHQSAAIPDPIRGWMG